MKKQITYVMSLLVATFLLLSCEKYNESEEITNGKEANSTLILRARAAAGNVETDATISYPVNIYIFRNDKCIEKVSIASADEQISLKLEEGSYNVYAIAGADEETYDLPTKENATKETVISLKSDKTHKDLMTAQNTVNLVYGEENTLVLSLSRKVMLIESVTINNVPTNVTNVTVAISPLYQNILLNGGYSSEKEDIQTITLTKEGESNIWKNTTGVFLLEASAPATIKVSLTTNSITKSYSYSSPQELKANHKININGTYNESGITLNGTITGATWEEPINITFNFDENGSTTEDNSGSEGGDDNSGDEVTSLVGTLYKDCYVLKAEKSGDNTVLTLMSTEEKNNLSFTEGDQTSIKNAVEKEFANLTASGISTWRLPSLEELKYIKANIETINANLEKLNKDKFFLSSGSSIYLYYFLSTSGEIMIYNTNDDSESAPKKDSKMRILRAFATETISN